MSFSGMVKEELSRHIGSGRHCRIAELAAIFTFCGSLEAGTDGRKSLRIQTENEALSRKGFTLLQKTFNIETDVSNSRIDRFRKGNLYCISIIDQFLVKEILDSAKLEFSGVSGGMPLVSNSIVYQRDCCKGRLYAVLFSRQVRSVILRRDTISKLYVPARRSAGSCRKLFTAFI